VGDATIGAWQFESESVNRIDHLLTSHPRICDAQHQRLRIKRVVVKIERAAKIASNPVQTVVETIQFLFQERRFFIVR